MSNSNSETFDIQATIIPMGNHQPTRIICQVKQFWKKATHQRKWTPSIFPKPSTSTIANIYGNTQEEKFLDFSRAFPKGGGWTLINTSIRSNLCSSSSRSI